MSSATLRRWARVGKIKSKRTKGGHRRFWVEQSIRVGVCYCRVSSSKQKDDLRRQVAAKREAYPGHEVIEDIGSGINFRRKGLNSLLERVLRGTVLGSGSEAYTSKTDPRNGQIKKIGSAKMIKLSDGKTYLRDNVGALGIFLRALSDATWDWASPKPCKNQRSLLITF